MSLIFVRHIIFIESLQGGAPVQASATLMFLFAKGSLLKRLWGFDMKIDKDTLSGLASLDDASLNAAIRMIASSAGFDLGKVSFEKSQLDSLRGALKNADDSDIERAKEIFTATKKRDGREMR